MAGTDLWWVNNGDDVEVEWSEGDWWPAKPTEVNDYPEARTDFIAYAHGWKKFNEWVGDHTRVRPPTGSVSLELEDCRRAYGTTEGHLVDGGEVVFEVECICGKRVGKGGQTEYRVQWVGDYKKDKRTWEAEDDIHHEWIEWYEAKLRQQSRAAVKKRPRRPPHVPTVAGGATTEERRRRADDAEILAGKRMR